MVFIIVAQDYGHPRPFYLLLQSVAALPLGDSCVVPVNVDGVTIIFRYFISFIRKNGNC